MAGGRLSADALLGDAARIEALREQIRRLAAFDAIGNPHVPTVLLVGETGTGKGLVARALHETGPRAEAAFVDVNCGAIPETMVEAELFGFEAGAFTDAKRTKPGLFEAASGGTLFLDEIDALSPALQSKVLKAIEDKRVRHLGAVTSRAVDVKLIAATQFDPLALIESGRLRADLYHRLAVLILAIPPLRARDDDSVLLAEHFLQTYAAAHQLTPKRLDAGAVKWLRSYEWPGNVRELGHLMERVTLLHPGNAIDAATLAELATPSAHQRSAKSAPAPQSTTNEEADIRAALDRFAGNVVRAAAELGIGRNALRYRMQRLGISRSGAETKPPPHAAAPQLADPTSELPRWEQKSVAVVVIGLAFPANQTDGAFDLWTATDRWQQIIVDRLEGFGGHVMDRSPSRYVAVFGLPRALEQTAQRAVHAALALQQVAAHTPGPRPALRAALHVGEARIDLATSDPLARVLPIGDTFTLPDRLLGHAGSGEVLASAMAARRIERTWHLAVRMLALGPDDADRVPAHAIGRLRSSELGTSTAMNSTDFVGRARELSLLQDALSRAASGQGQAVFIAGDAGIGKSRLLAEFQAAVANRPHQWIEGRCAAYGASTPFYPLIDGLRRYLHIDDDDDDDATGAKIAAALVRLGSELRWTEPFIRQMLSLDVQEEAVRALDSASRRSELFRALRALTVRIAEMDPLILAIEDLHWIDLASQEYLMFLADIVPTSRLLLILTHRPGYQHPFGDRSYFARLPLMPLSTHEIATMTNALLGSNHVPHDVRALIAGKAEGNPFFVEELTKSLLEDGTLQRQDGDVKLVRQLDTVSVPESIQDVLIARIDRLAEESRRAIQTASVIGREFALRLLAKITEAGDRIQTQVDELRGLELIYEKALHPELAYMFKHALTHDVAYESVLRERRAALHRTIGHAVEELYADRLAEHYEVLAHHFSRGEDWEHAVAYLERSADKAADTHANRAVVEHCGQALAITLHLGGNQVDAVRRRLFERLGRAHWYLSEFIDSAIAYEEAAGCSRDPEDQTMLLGNAAYSRFWGHDYENAQRCIDATAALSRQHALITGEAMAANAQAFFHGVHDADLDAYERGSRDALKLCAQRPCEPIEAQARFQLAQIAEWTGAYRDAIAGAEQVLAMGRRLQLSDLIALSAWFLGKARCCIGDFGGALAQLDAAYQICDRIGDRAWKSRLLNTLGWCLAEIGSVERAQQCNQQAATLARELGDPEILANADVNLAMNLLALGDTRRARVQLERFEANLADHGDPWMHWRYAMHLIHARGAIELAGGNLESALAAAQSELLRAEQYRAPKVTARAHLLAASVHMAMGQHDAAELALNQAAATATRIGYQRAIWESARGLAELACRRGDRATETRYRAAAHAAASLSAQSLSDPELRARLLHCATESRWFAL